MVFHLDGVLVVSVAVPSELADLPLPGDDELVAGPFNRDHQGYELRTFELSENKTCGKLSDPNVGWNLFLTLHICNLKSSFVSLITNYF